MSKAGQRGKKSPRRHGGSWGNWRKLVERTLVGTLLFSVLARRGSNRVAGRASIDLGLADGA
eukprot:117094-Chlamydomonas_euryale.AAC.1